MKTIIVSVFALSVSLQVPAQSDWESPAMRQTQTQEKVCKNADDQDRVDAVQKHYSREGAVPEEDGKVVFHEVLRFQTVPATEIYDATYRRLEELAQGGNQIQSRIVLTNRKEHIIVAKFSEWMEFSRSLFSLDRTKVNYTVIATCSDGSLDLRIERISYNYEEGRVSGFKATAEELITDRKALNKKRTALKKGTAKFRRKTIDRIERLFEEINSMPIKK